MTAPHGALDAAGSAALVLEAVEDGRRAVVVLRPKAGDPSATRRRVWIEGPGGLRTEGTLGDPDLDARADARARALLAGSAPEGLHDDLYYELHGPRPELVIVGAGHIARPLCAAAALLGFRVTVLDDRPDFATRERFPEAEAVRTVDFDDPFAPVPLHAATHVVLVTRGHRYDYECLRRLVARSEPLPYVGMIGSRRRVRATLEALAREGVPPHRMKDIRSPVGLDLGAQTPSEIAISVAAELVLLRRGGSGRPLREVERVLERLVRPEAAAAAGEPEGDA